MTIFEGEAGKLLTLKYFEEGEESKHEKRKWVVKNMLTYDGKNDFSVWASGERMNYKITGSELNKTFPKVTEIKITRDYDGLIIEYFDNIGVCYYRRVVNEYAFDFIEIKGFEVE